MTLFVGISLTRSDISKLKAEESDRLNLGLEIIRAALILPVDQLKGIAREPVISQAIRLPVDQARSALEEHLTTLLYRNPFYEQVRWVGANGMELVRIKHGPEKPFAVPAPELEDRSHLENFKRSIVLPPGMFFMTALDLSVEHGAVEVPHIPVIRFAIRLPSHEGRDLGLFVVNLRARILLDHLARIARADAEDALMLLNPQGYWLLAQDPQDTFGFATGEPGKSFAARHSGEWAAISMEASGQMLMTSGLWTWGTFDPQSILGSNSRAAEKWKLVSHVSAATIAHLQWQRWWPLLLLAAVSLGLMLYGVYKYRQLWQLREVGAAERALTKEKEQAQRRLILATEGADVGVWNWDLATGQLEWSDLCKAHLALPEGMEPTFERFYAAIHPDDCENIKKEIEKAVEKSQDYYAEYRIVHPDGSIRWIAAPGRVYAKPDGTLEGMGGVIFDITARKEAEEKLRTLNISLESQVEERTKQLAAANAAKSEFLANMSHEIRTPMSAVIGLSDLLSETELTDLQRDYVDKIGLSGKALLGVLNDILDHSKIEAGQLQIESVPLRIGELLDKCQALFSMQAGSKGLSLRFEVDPAVPGVLLGDPLRLLQVINNLVGNALKFTASGGIDVTVESAEQDQDTVLLNVRVKDTGVGLTREQQGRLFAAFQQAEGSTARPYGGSGLGLSINKRLVELMGGEIGVESEPGKGSTFWFTVRLRKEDPSRAEEATLADARSSSAKLREMAAAIRGARVLLVDDSATNQLITKTYLRKMGLEVETADDGRVAIEKAKGADFDAILMDLHMPDIDGFAAAKAIRADEARQRKVPPVPIIALTTAAMVKDLQASEAAGMNDHITKPVDPVRLAQTLTKWIKARLREVGRLAAG